MVSARDYKKPLTGKNAVVDPAYRDEFERLYGPQGMSATDRFRIIANCTMNVASVTGTTSMLITFQDSGGRVSTSSAHRFLVLDNN